MSFSERLRFFRKKRELTQKELGLMMGYPEKSADIRIAQYESGSRCPKDEMIKDLAEALEVSPKALMLPDIDNKAGLMHILFALEDLYGVRASAAEGDPVLFVDPAINPNAAELHSMLLDWCKQSEKLRTGRISRTKYDQWRYNYPEIIKIRRAKPVKVKRVVLRSK